MLALEAMGLVKTFRVKRKPEGLMGSFRSLLKPEWGEKTAVAGIDLRVEAGETLAFLGPNGAGKSTTIKMLTGILHPTSGHARVLGMVPWRERAALAFRIGAVFGQKSQLWYHLPPADTFELLGRMYELGREDYRRRRDELVERFDLGPHMQTPVRKLSLGERMRCEIAAAFLHRPEMLFLDEPTIGLDVVVKRRIRELIAERNREEGTTVFLTSHDPSDIEQLCRRAVVIHHGAVIFDAPVERLKREVLTYKTVRLKLRDGERLPETLPDGVKAAEAGPSAWRLSVDTAAASIEEVLAAFVGRCAIEDMTVEDPPMEDVIRTIYEGGSRLRPTEEGTAS
ncbi:MAG: ABC transporter [Thermobacillus sp. ZCTH02-B1]|mgnify:FL=1|nr:MAG: ABC transporter [Thermobacillus sp. ZCTH02-B1]